MSEVEKQESQKTVVAFITGLLIGGLLVWVFSSSPEKNVEPVVEEEVTTEKTTDTETVASEKATEEVVGSAIADSVVTGTGVLSVADQKAGKLVVLGTTEFPSKAGWVVVREYADGMLGNILGAARYSSAEGLVPANVELVRETVTGSSYQVSFYGTNGDSEFKITDDKPLEAKTATFKAN